MNRTPALDVRPASLAALAIGLVLSWPVTAQQHVMHMPMQHDAAKADQSAKDAKNAKGASKKESPKSSSPRKRGASAFAFQAVADKSLDRLAPSMALALRAAFGVRVCSPANAVRLRGIDEQKADTHAMHDMNVPSMQGMRMHGSQPMPIQPKHPVELQHLDWGNMIGVRPEPCGLAGSFHGTVMSSMEGMDMSSMQGGKAPPDARSPDYSDGYRYTDMPGMAMSDHAREGMLLVDQLEYAHDNHGNDAAFFDGQFWYGRDFNKFWLKAEGEYARGKLEDLRTEALWYHATSAYWGTQLGVREDFGEGPNRTWAAFGVEGLAPYWFETEATLYVGTSGRTAGRIQFEYEERITQRLVLQPKFEVNLFGKDDRERGIGSGLSDAELGIRLRYAFKREFAPYIGVVWRQRFGRTADLWRAQGEPASDLSVVAGLRFWF